MEHEEDPRTDQERIRARTGSASTSTNENMEAESELVPLQNAADARIDARSVEAPSEVAQSGAASGQAKPTEPPALNKWQKFWRGVLHVDTAKMDPWTAARNAIGVALPLAVGIALGMPLGGLAVSSGALNVSYSDSHDPYKQRARRMLAASALCAVAVMAGGLVGHHNVAAVTLVSFWAFGSGMAVAAGPTGESLGVISLVVLIIYSAQTLTPGRAVQAGALAFAGGLMQMLLSLALWPARV